MVLDVLDGAQDGQDRVPSWAAGRSIPRPAWSRAAIALAPAGAQSPTTARRVYGFERRLLFWLEVRSQLTLMLASQEQAHATCLHVSPGLRATDLTAWPGRRASRTLYCKRQLAREQLCQAGRL